MRSQRVVDLLTLAAAALLGLAAVVTWTHADPGDVSLAGKDITRAPVTIALAAIAALVVIRLAGTTMRRILSILVTLLGAAAIAVATQVRPDRDELARLRPVLSEVVTDDVSIRTGPAPWFALAGGLALVIAGLVGLSTAHRWRRPTMRYERDHAPDRRDEPEDQWKAIDAGDDPTV